MPRFRLALLLAFMVGALLPGAPAKAYTPATSPDFFGVNGAFLRAFVAPNQAASLDGLARSMGEQEISWARLTFDQSVEERQRGTFNWYVPDTMIAALARHGVRGAGSFVGTSPWAQDPALEGSCWYRGSPYDMAGWTEWVAAAARRYGPDGTFWSSHPELPSLPIRTWEIGNEVNSHNYWCPSANPEHYAKVFSRSAAAISAVDPSAQVIVGGLAPRFGWRTETDLDVPSFLSRMIAAQPSLASRISAVAIHPYAGTASQSLEVLLKFRQALRDAGIPNTPMIANEIGWYTQGAAGPLLTNQAGRATQIAEVANRFWRTDCGISGLAPYSWITLEQDPNNSEHWYGLADPSTGTPNAGGLAYGDQIELALGRASSPPPSTTIKLCGSGEQIPAPGPPQVMPSSQPAPHADKPPTKKKRKKKRRKARVRNSIG